MLAYPLRQMPLEIFGLAQDAPCTERAAKTRNDTAIRCTDLMIAHHRLAGGSILHYPIVLGTGRHPGYRLPRSE